MFQDYSISEKLTFPNKVEDLCISELGIFVAKTRKKLIISHIKGVKDPIDLLQYFKEELNFNYSQCREIVSFPNFTKDKSSSCFGVIMDLDFWCVIARLSKT